MKQQFKKHYLIKMRKILLLILCVGAMFSSCKKEEETIYVPDNVAPDDETIEEVTYSNYVQKLYISLLGRKPTDSENTAAIAELKAKKLNYEGRNDLINSITNQDSYYDNEYSIMRADLLHNADSASFEESKQTLEFALTLTANPIEIAFIQVALDKIEPLIALEANLINGNKSIKEAHGIVVDNNVYDQINMGAENYVVSLFQNFLLRYPTTAELESGIDIYEGIPGVLFTSSAKNKDELINVFFNYKEYFEGQVRINYLRFLYREPTSDEIVLLANEYQSSGDYVAMQSYILSLDEYAGVE